MTQWLVERRKYNNFNENLINNQKKSIYSEYLNTIGIYYDFAKADYINSLK